MSKEVFLKAYAKAEKETGSFKKTHVTTYLSDVLLERFQFQIHERTLRGYYNAFSQNIEPNFSGLGTKLTEHLSVYLGYDNYAHFLADESIIDKVTEEDQGDGETESDKDLVDKGETPNKDYLAKGVLISLIVVVSGLFAYQGFDTDKPKCMVWNGTSYEKAECEPKYNLKYKVEVVNYVEELAENFRRLDVDCDTPLYQDGKPIVWCSRVEIGKYEYFNYRDKHPITGDSLKAVSDHIRDNYICVDEE